MPAMLISSVAVVVKCRPTDYSKLSNYTERCLKITEKVSLKFASEASYVYNLSGQKSIKMPKMVNFGEFLKT